MSSVLFVQQAATTCPYSLQKDEQCT